MKKKIGALLLALAMVAAYMPMMALTSFADPAPTNASIDFSMNASWTKDSPKKLTVVVTNEKNKKEWGGNNVTKIRLVNGNSSIEITKPAENTETATFTFDPIKGEYKLQQYVSTDPNPSKIGWSDFAKSEKVTINEISLTYHKNDGVTPEVTEKKSALVIGDATETFTVIDNPDWSVEGKRFTEWNTKADGSGTSYAKDAELTLSADGDLYAQWESNHTCAINSYDGDTNGNIVALCDSPDYHEVPTLMANISLALEDGHECVLDEESQPTNQIIYDGTGIGFKVKDWSEEEGELFDNLLAWDEDWGTLSEITYVDGENVESTEAPKNVGEYTAKMTFTPKEGDPCEATYDFEIVAKEISIVWDNDDLTYNGSEQKPTAELDGEVDGDDVSVTVSGGATDAQEDAYEATATLDGDDAGNYVIADGDESHDFIISPKELSVVWDNDDLTYNGSEQKPTAELDGEVDGDDVSVTVSGGATDAQEDAYEATATLDGDDAGNYVIADGDESHDFIISPKAVSVKANNASKKYGTSDPTLTATVDGLCGDDTVEYNLVRDTGDAEGTYVITASGDENQGNYIVSYTNGTFTITHNIDTTIDGVNPTIGKAGYKTAYKCSGCGKYFEDIEGTKEIGDEDAYNAWIAEGGDGYLAALTEEDIDDEEDEDEGVKTGDSNALMIYLVLGLVAAGGATFVLKRRED